MRTCLWIAAWLTLGLVGCGEAGKKGATGSAAPSLDSPNPQERAAAAREAAEKYGAKP
jgi:hypothetical protein